MAGITPEVYGSMVSGDEKVILQAKKETALAQVNRDFIEAVEVGKAGNLFEAFSIIGNLFAKEQEVMCPVSDGGEKQVSERLMIERLYGRIVHEVISYFFREDDGGYGIRENFTVDELVWANVMNGGYIAGNVNRATKVDENALRKAISMAMISSFKDKQENVISNLVAQSISQEDLIKVHKYFEEHEQDLSPLNAEFIVANLGSRVVGEGIAEFAAKRKVSSERLDEMLRISSEQQYELKNGGGDEAAVMRYVAGATKLVWLLTAFGRGMATGKSTRYDVSNPQFGTPEMMDRGFRGMDPKLAVEKYRKSREEKVVEEFGKDIDQGETVFVAERLIQEMGWGSNNG